MQRVEKATMTTASQFTIDGIHSWQYGTGDVSVLLVHGWASSSLLYENLIQSLGDVATFYAFDFPGHGQSDPLDIPPTVSTYVDILERYLLQSGLRPDVILAHSMGGLITLKLLQRQPNITDRLVLICPVVSGEYGVLSLGSTLVRTDWGRWWLNHSRPFWEFFQNPELHQLMPHPPLNSAHLSQRIREDFQNTDWATGVQLLQSMCEHDASPHLPDIQQETLLMVGVYDTTVPPSESYVAAQLLPNAHLERFENSRHIPFENEPEKAIALLREFLSSPAKPNLS